MASTHDPHHASAPSGDPAIAQPLLHGSRPARGQRPHTAVLVLHGGKVRSTDPARPWHLSSVRMRPFVRSLRHALGDEADVAWLQYRYRGWNGADRSPVTDARWALRQLHARHGDVPVVVVGHSMGGRTAAAIADDPSVVAVMALAPWWPSGTETDTMRPGQSLLVVHGTADSWTDPRTSEAATERAARRGIDARWIGVPRAGHFMLGRAGLWTDTVRDFVVDQSRGSAPPKS